MRGRVLLWVSLGLNIALAVMLVRFSPEDTHRSDRNAVLAVTPQPVGAARSLRTNVVVRRQNFTWDEIESADFPTYIANLRAIGCPEATIRDIIVADVNQLFARRRATEVVTAEQKWWLSEPDPEVTQQASEKLQTLDAERRTLLSTLLGPDWESSYYPYPAYPDTPPLDGPVLGALPPRTKQAVRDIESRATERRQAYLDSLQKEGRQPDPAELAKMRQQTRADLAQALSPEQLEEYLLRYSNHASSLRGELHGIANTPDQFRALFRLTDGIDQQLQLLSGTNDTAIVVRRQELEKQREQVLQQTLGTDDYKQYKLLQDSLYRQVQEVAQQAGTPADKIVPLYEISRATEQERQRIRDDGTLSDEQKEQALETVQAAQRNSWRKLLGDAFYQRYLQETTKP
jgi:uncharacterized damage-inducible protein DinB